jgi:hypothetical protein
MATGSPSMPAASIVIPFVAANAIAKWQPVALHASEGQVTGTTTAGTALTIGIAQNAAAAGQNVDVLVLGCSLVRCGAAVAKGAALFTDGTDGYVDDFTPGGGTTLRYCIGFALEAATNDGDVISALILPSAVVRA